MRERILSIVLSACFVPLAATSRSLADSLFMAYSPDQPVSISGWGFGETVTGNSSTVLLTQSSVNTTYSGTYVGFLGTTYTDSMTVNWSGFTPDGFLLTAHGQANVNGVGHDSLEAILGGGFVLTSDTLVHIVASYNETNGIGTILNGFSLETGFNPNVNQILNTGNVSPGYRLDEVIDLPAGAYNFGSGAGANLVDGTFDFSFGITAVTAAPVPSSAWAAVSLLFGVWTIRAWGLRLRRRNY